MICPHPRNGTLDFSMSPRTRSLAVSVKMAILPKRRRPSPVRRMLRRRHPPITWSRRFHTYGLPVIITNCGNDYGPYQFPEKSFR